MAKKKKKKIVMCEPSQNMWPKKIPANQSAIAADLAVAMHCYTIWRGHYENKGAHPNYL